MEPGARGSAELSGVRSRWSVLDRFARLSCLLWLLAVAWLAGASAAAPGIAAMPTSPLATLLAWAVPLRVYWVTLRCSFFR